MKHKPFLIGLTYLVIFFGFNSVVIAGAVTSKEELVISTTGGGIKIKSSVGTLGHSDGDPVLHAIIDSIMGACKMGDIGEKFSDKSKKYKNIRSNYLLKQIIEEYNKVFCFKQIIDFNG